MKQLNIIIGAYDNILDLSKTDVESFKEILAHVVKEVSTDVYGEKAPELLNKAIITSSNIKDLVEGVYKCYHPHEYRMDLRKKLNIPEWYKFISDDDLNILNMVNDTMLKHVISKVESVIDQYDLHVNAIVVTNAVIDKLKHLALFRGSKHISLIFTDVDDYNNIMINKYGMSSSDIDFTIINLRQIGGNADE